MRILCSPAALDQPVVCLLSPRQRVAVLSAADIRRHFELLDGELLAEGIVGELYLVGGAVMCLVFNTRPSTNDVDGYLVPTRALCTRL